MAKIFTKMIGIFSPAAIAQEKQQPIHTDIKLSEGGPASSDIERVIKERPKALGKSLSYEHMGGGTGGLGLMRFTDGFVAPPYDLAEIGRAADVEPFVAQSIRKHREQILKEGWELQGQEDDMVDYVHQRLYELQMASGIPTQNWIRETITNLITYHNAFLVFRRDKLRSSGRRITMYNKLLDPIASIYPIDPTTMKVSVDKFGTPKKWKQVIEGSGNANTGGEKKFNSEDIISITIDKKSGMSFGTPYVLPVLDDIRALRRIEELAVFLTSKEAFPLYHYKVGTPEKPAELLDGGGSEVDIIQAQIASMPLQGNVVTSERHEISLISKEGGSLNIHPFLEYFEKRVLAGLRLSELDLGRGGTSNRACYDGSTETLTNNGWKHYWEVDADYDKIATLNPQNDKIEFHKPNSLHVYPFDGLMHHYLAGNVDVMVTPDHDMWALSSEGEDPNFKKVKSKDIEGQVYFQTTAEWDGTELGYIEIADQQVDRYDWLRFVGYFIKYGKINKSTNRIKFIVRDRTVAPAISALLEMMPMSYREYDNDSYFKFEISSVKLTRLISREFNCNIYPIKLPDNILSGARNDLEVIKEILMPADSFVYHARTSTIAGQVQEMLLKLGKNSRILTTERTHRVVVIGDYNEAISTDDREETYYCGDVYCFNVPNHLFITRRGGCIGIHGNTASNISKIVADAAKDYQEVFANALNFGLILPLLLEGGFDVTPQNMVKLRFPMIDREEFRAHQNHGLQLYLSNTISETEFRKDYLNRKPLSDEERALTPRELDLEAETTMAETQKENQIEVEKSKPKPAGPLGGASSSSGSSSSSKTSKSSTSKSLKSANNRGQPRNQSGTSPAKPRIAANDSAGVMINYDTAKSEVVGYMEQDLDAESRKKLALESMAKFVESSVALTTPMLEGYIDQGNKDATGQLDLSEITPIGNRAKQRFYNNFVQKSYWKVIGPYIRQVFDHMIPDTDGNTDSYRVHGSLEALRKSIIRLLDDQIITAYRFGFAKTAKTFGKTEVYLEETESNSRKTIEVSKGIIYRHLLPTGKKSEIIVIGSAEEEQE